MHVAKFQFWASGEWTVPAHQIISRSERFKVEENIRTDFVNRISALVNVGEVFNRIIVFKRMLTEYSKLVENMSFSLAHILRESFEIREIFSTAKYLFAILLMRNVTLSKTMKFTVKIPEKTHILVNNIIRYLLLVLRMEKKKE
jgi:hypothetical protein